ERVDLALRRKTDAKGCHLIEPIQFEIFHQGVKVGKKRLKGKDAYAGGQGRVKGENPDVGADIPENIVRLELVDPATGFWFLDQKMFGPFPCKSRRTIESNDSAPLDLTKDTRDERI